MEEKGVNGKWGKAFQWEIRGARVEQVWAVTGDFVRADKWASSILQSCELVEGEPQKPGCVRRPVLYPSAPGKPSAYSMEKLLEMDELHHRYSYTVVEGTLPGFSLMQDYVSTFKLSPLPSDEGSTLLQWSFVCCPVAALSEEKAQQIAFSLYQAAINDLKARLSLPDDAISLLSTPSY